MNRSTESLGHRDGILIVFHQALTAKAVTPSATKLYSRFETHLREDEIADWIENGVLPEDSIPQ